MSNTSRAKATLEIIEDVHGFDTQKVDPVDYCTAPQGDVEAAAKALQSIFTSRDGFRFRDAATAALAAGYPQLVAERDASKEQADHAGEIMERLQARIAELETKLSRYDSTEFIQSILDAQRAGLEAGQRWGKTLSVANAEAATPPIPSGWTRDGDWLTRQGDGCWIVPEGAEVDSKVFGTWIPAKFNLPSARGRYIYRIPALAAATAPHQPVTDADHLSDCATHNEPAYPAGDCDCRVAMVTDARDAVAQWLVDRVEINANHPELHCWSEEVVAVLAALAPKPRPTPSVEDDSADPVNHPSHYTSHPSGVECITITEFMGFNIGNAVKYLWRADEKGAPLQDLEKAAWYIAREIQRRKNYLQ